MKKCIVLLVLLALVMITVSTQAKKDEVPLGSKGNGILCTDHFPVGPAKSTATLAEMAEALAFPPYPYEDTFTLHSYPSSNYKLYLDFDGHKGYRAWDPAGDGADFSEAERLLIQKIWFLTSNCPPLST